MLINELVKLAEGIATLKDKKTKKPIATVELDINRDEGEIEGTIWILTAKSKEDFDEILSDWDNPITIWVTKQLDRKDLSLMDIENYDIRRDNTNGGFFMNFDINFDEYDE